MKSHSKIGLFSRTDLVLVDESSVSERTNLVKLGLGLLKEFGHRGPHQFASVEAEVTLIENLTLRDHLCLSSQSLESYRDSHKRYDALLATIKNQSLLYLLGRLNDLERRPHEASPEERQTVALCQALLQNGPYIFLDRVELHLGDALCEHMLRALCFELHAKGRMAIVRPHHQELWKGVATKKLHLNNGDFVLTPLIKQVVREKFLGPITPESTSGLKFTIPGEIKKAS
jgi:ABC-type lipoprotein export system ATPase subunit